MAAQIAPHAVEVRRLGHDLEVLLLLEQQPQAPPHDSMVVGDHDADRRRFRLIGTQLSLGSVLVGHRRHGIAARSTDSR